MRESEVIHHTQAKCRICQSSASSEVQGNVNAVKRTTGGQEVTAKSLDYGRVAMAEGKNRGAMTIFSIQWQWLELIRIYEFT